MHYNSQGELQKKLELDGVIIMDGRKYETDDKLFIYGIDTYVSHDMIYIFEVAKSDFTLISEYTRSYSQGISNPRVNGFHFVGNNIYCAVPLNDGSVELMKFKIE